MPDPWADPKSRSTFEFYNLDHRSIEIQNAGDLLFGRVWHRIFLAPLHLDTRSPDPHSCGLSIFQSQLRCTHDGLKGDNLGCPSNLKMATIVVLELLYF